MQQIVGQRANRGAQSNDIVCGSTHVPVPAGVRADVGLVRTSYCDPDSCSCDACAPIDLIVDRCNSEWMLADVGHSVSGPRPCPRRAAQGCAHLLQTLRRFEGCSHRHSRARTIRIRMRETIYFGKASSDCNPRSQLGNKQHARHCTTAQPEQMRLTSIPSGALDTASVVLSPPRPLHSYTHTHSPPATLRSILRHSMDQHHSCGNSQLGAAALLTPSVL